MKKDIFISMLKYGKDNLLEGFTMDQTKAHLEGIGFSFDSEEKVKNFTKVFCDCFYAINNTPQAPNQICFLKTESYFNLLEYEELKDARKSSFRAQIFSGIAILISVITLLFSIYYSQKTLLEPVTLDSDQMKILEEIGIDENVLEKININLEEIKSNTFPKE